MRKIFTVSRVLLTAALYGLVIQSQAAPDKGELEVLVMSLCFVPQDIGACEATVQRGRDITEKKRNTRERRHK